MSNIAFAIVLKSLALPFNEVLREKREDAYERLRIKVSMSHKKLQGQLVFGLIV